MNIKEAIQELEKAVGQIFQKKERIAGKTIVILQEWIDFWRKYDDESRKN